MLFNCTFTSFLHYKNKSIELFENIRRLGVRFGSFVWNQTTYLISKTYKLIPLSREWEIFQINFKI
jgi:hypothetical protein